jgi:hypothetical protein
LKITTKPAKAGLIKEQQMIRCYKMDGNKCLTPCPAGHGLSNETASVGSSFCWSVCEYNHGTESDHVDCRAKPSKNVLDRVYSDGKSEVPAGMQSGFKWYVYEVFGKRELTREIHTMDVVNNFIQDME